MPATILIADDEALIAELLAALLEDEGYRALRARDGAAALALAERERPALVLADVMMPGLSGVELAHRLRGRADGYAPPVVLLSAVAPPGSLPARTHFLAKPFDIDTLAALVASLLAAP